MLCVCVDLRRYSTRPKRRLIENEQRQGGIYNVIEALYNLDLFQRHQWQSNSLDSVLLFLDFKINPHCNDNVTITEIYTNKPNQIL